MPNGGRTRQTPEEIRRDAFSSSGHSTSEIHVKRVEDLRAAVTMIFKKLSLNYPSASDWPHQKDRINTWVGECVNHQVTHERLLLAAKNRPPSPFPPSVSELIALALPSLTDEDVRASLARAVRVAATDEYHLLNDHEWWAFSVVGRWSLSHDHQEVLLSRWKALLKQAIQQSPAPLPRPKTPADKAHRLEAQKSESSLAKARSAIAFAQSVLKKGASQEQLQNAVAFSRLNG